MQAMDVGAFASLVVENQIPEVVDLIETAVFGSFQEDLAPGRIVIVTGARTFATPEKMKERVGLCMKIFRILRGDLAWSIPRIRDAMGGFLRKELDGVAWDPDNSRTSWTTPAE
jgi:hypothetical protein